MYSWRGLTLDSIEQSPAKNIIAWKRGASAHFLEPQTSNIGGQKAGYINKNYHRRSSEGRAMAFKKST